MNVREMKLCVKPLIVQHWGAILVQQELTDCEELHDLAGIVFIRKATVVIVSSAADECQVLAHQRVVRHLAKQVFQVAERVPDKNVVVVHPQLVEEVISKAWRAGDVDL